MVETMEGIMLISTGFIKAPGSIHVTMRRVYVVGFKLLIRTVDADYQWTNLN